MKNKKEDMQKLIYTLLFIIGSSTAALSQPTVVKDMGKRLFTLTATDRNGRQSSAVAIPVSSNEMVTLWSALKNANKVTVTDQKGKAYQVESLVGCDEIYDLCKIRINGAKIVPITLSPSVAGVGSDVWATDAKKDSKMQQMKVKKVETFADSLSYYVLDGDALHTDAGQAVITSSGNIVGLTHLSGTPLSINSADLRQVAALSTNGLSINDRSLSASTLPIDLPRDIEQARIFLLLAGQKDTKGHYSTYIDRFINLYPNETDGYVAKANSLTANEQLSEAEATMAQAMKNCNDKAEAQYEWAKLIYSKVALNTDSAATVWTFDNALSHIDDAIKINPLSAYKHLKAQIVYAQGNYEEALTQFTSLQQSDIRGSEVFYEAAQCRSRLGADNNEILALLDSAVAVAPQPLSVISAPYVLARGEMYAHIEQPKQALADYNLYDSLMVGSASADFYYLRHECEVKLRQYQPALNDLAHAAVVEPSNPAYIASLASLQLKLNQIDDALRTTELALNRFSDYSVLYVVRGLALIRQEKKQEGIAALTKAQELGNEQASELLERYK